MNLSSGAPDSGIQSYADQHSGAHPDRHSDPPDTGMSNAPAVLQLRGVSKAFPGVLALDQLHLDLLPGQVHCLIGENGAGKSTLVSILGGFLQPDTGTIEMAGTRVSFASPRAAARSGIGVVHQHSSLVESFTVRENLSLGWAKNRRRIADPAGSAAASNGEATKQADSLAEFSQLLNSSLDPAARVSSLGLGQRQLVEIVRALRDGGRVLVLDEPTAMLTPDEVDRLAVQLRRVADAGVAVLLITHRLAEVFAMADAVTVLRAGRVTDRLTRDDLGIRPQLRANEARHRAAQPETAEPIELPPDPPALFDSQQDPKARLIEAMFGSASRLFAGSERDFAGGGVHRSLRRGSGLPRLVLRSVTTTSHLADTEAQDIEIEVEPGQILAIAGIDGHGQRALAEAIAGQRKIANGQLLFDGEDIGRVSVKARQRLGVRYITDDRVHEATVGSLSVALNLLLKRIGERPFWRLGRMNRRAVSDFALERIAQFGISTPSPWTAVAKLSGGNIQKVLLARELGEGARLVVASKPTTGLDFLTATAVRTALKDFAKSGGTVLLISTDLDEIVAVAHRIAVIRQGRIQGTVDNGGADVVATVGRLMAGASA